MLPCVPLGAAEPQADNADWENLKQLVPGTEIQVVLTDAKAYRGEFQAVSDDAIVVRTTTGDQMFARQSVLRVSSKRQGHRVRNAALGALIGGGIGAALGSGPINLGGVSGRAVSALTGMWVFGGIGAGVGAALPTGRWGDVYRAR